MKPLNGYLIVEKEEQENALITNDDGIIVKVIEACEDSIVNKGDRVVYKGKKFEVMIEGKPVNFILEDDLIAVCS